jgi:hypothetical protein
MQALDSFISPIPSFEGDIPIPAIPVSAQPPGDEADSDPSTGASAGIPRTQARKRKATANPSPTKKTKKAPGKPPGESRSMNLYPQYPHRLFHWLPVKESRSFDRAGDTILSIFHCRTFSNREPLCRVPQDIDPVTSIKSVPDGGESPKVDKPSSL